MHESDDIIKYLFQTYGDGRVPWVLSLGPLTVVHCALGNAPRWVQTGAQGWSVGPCCSASGRGQDCAGVCRVCIEETGGWGHAAWASLVHERQPSTRGRAAALGNPKAWRAQGDDGSGLQPLPTAQEASGDLGV